jgi:hypothetical protein
MGRYLICFGFLVLVIHSDFGFLVSGFTALHAAETVMHPLRALSIYHFTFSMLYSVFDMEMVEFARGGKLLAFQIPDVLIHAVVDAVDHLLHLLRRSFHDELNPAIGEIANVSQDIMT